MVPATITLFSERIRIVGTALASLDLLHKTRAELDLHHSRHPIIIHGRAPDGIKQKIR